MKKILVAILCVCSFSAVQQAQAADLMGIYVAPKFNFSFVNADVKGRTPLGNASIGKSNSDTIGGALAIGYDFNPSFNVPLRTEIEYAIYGDIKESESATVGAATARVKTTLNMQSLFLNVYYDFHNSTKFTPYLGAGLGIAFVNLDGKLRSNLGNDSLDAKRQSNFAWNVGLGAAYAFTDNVSIDLGYRYAKFGQAKTKTEAGISGKVNNVSMHQVMLGARFTF